MFGQIIRKQVPKKVTGMVKRSIQCIKGFFGKKKKLAEEVIARNTDEHGHLLLNSQRTDALLHDILVGETPNVFDLQGDEVTEKMTLPNRQEFARKAHLSLHESYPQKWKKDPLKSTNERASRYRKRAGAWVAWQAACTHQPGKNACHPKSSYLLVEELQNTTDGMLRRFHGGEGQGVNKDKLVIADVEYPRFFCVIFLFCANQCGGCALF